MKLLVIDGMGGGMGKAIIEHLKTELPTAEITAVGTNAMATSAMLKAGAHHCATGENAVLYNAAHTDCILGAMGILVTNSMHGEISPAMAAAISESAAHKILIPTEQCNVTVLGVAPKPMQTYIEEIARIVASK